MSTDRKAEILNTFMRLVCRFGFDKTTMREVAKEVGISVGVIYIDFKNKEDLIDAYIQRIIQQFSFLTDQILDQNLTSEQLLHDLIIKLHQNICRLSIEDRGFWQFLKGNEGQKYFRKFRPSRNNDPIGLTKKIEQIMAIGVQDGSFEIEDIPKTAFIFNSVFKGLFPDLIELEKNQEEVLQDYEDVLAFLLKAIRKK